MCGIIGVYKHDGPVSVEIYEGLLMLQHRGQDSAGMVTTDWQQFREHKANGLVRDVFEDKNLLEKKMTGSCGIGHVRYPTAGSASASEAQPFFVNSPLGIYLIHNGNLTNTDELRELLATSHSFFNRHMRTDSDSEVLLNVLADEVHRAHQRCLQSGRDPNAHKRELVLEAGAATMRLLSGAYSCICLVKGVGLVAFRDPHGIRPLVLGQRRGPGGTEWAVASEDCAFGPLAFERVRDVQPGEMVVISPEGTLTAKQVFENATLSPCLFEYIYLARPDSVLNSISVYNFQLGLGTRLAAAIARRNWDIDVVVPVPDGSRPAAIQVCAELGLPYREGLVKNRYVGRTFIMPDQRTREVSVRRKLNAMPAVFEGKSVLLIDDSIVRGTTMAQIVDMVRRAGAKRVYLASASPPVKYPNVYGVDMPNRKEFVAHGLDEEAVRQVLGADGLVYQSVEDLIAVGKELNPTVQRFDAACFDGHYVTGDVDDAYLDELEASGRGAGRRRSGARVSLVGGAAGFGPPGAASAAAAPATPAASAA
jgi:amidophosphoribosyltransferase